MTFSPKNEQLRLVCREHSTEMFTVHAYRPGTKVVEPRHYFKRKVNIRGYIISVIPYRLVRAWPSLIDVVKQMKGRFQPPKAQCIHFIE